MAVRLGVATAAMNLGRCDVHGIAERLAPLLGAEVALVATTHVHAHQPAQVRAAAASAAASQAANMVPAR